jgi:hypothetical protein
MGANGSGRIALAQIQLQRSSPQSQNEKLLALSKKGAKQPKFPLKYPTKSNRSK